MSDSCVIKVTDSMLLQVDDIDQVFHKLLKYVGIHYKLHYKVPSKCLLNIYYAFVYPHILYGIELYANTYYSFLDKLITK